MGVVRQAVKRSAGSSGLVGKDSDFPQAANWILSPYDWIWAVGFWFLDCRIFRLMLFNKSFEVQYNIASMRTIKDVETRYSKPNLNIVQ